MSTHRGPFHKCRDDWQTPGKSGDKTKARAATMPRQPITETMLVKLQGMANGRRVMNGRGHTMLALEKRGLVKRHLSINPAWSDRFTITETGMSYIVLVSSFT